MTRRLAQTADNQALTYGTTAVSLRADRRTRLCVLAAAQLVTHSECGLAGGIRQCLRTPFYVLAALLIRSRRSQIRGNRYGIAMTGVAAVIGVLTAACGNGSA